jgi:hypothetical protein
MNLVSAAVCGSAAFRTLVSAASDGFAFLTRATRLHQGRLAARRAWDDLWGGRLPAGTTRTPNDDDANEEHKTEG